MLPELLPDTTASRPRVRVAAMVNPRFSHWFPDIAGASTCSASTVGQLASSSVQAKLPVMVKPGTCGVGIAGVDADGRTMSLVLPYRHC